MAKVAKSEEKLVPDGNWDDLLRFRNDEQKIEVPFENKLYLVKYKVCSFERENQIVRDVMTELGPKADPHIYERKKQEELMKAMVTEIAGVRMDVGKWASMPFSFGESLRLAFWASTGEYRSALLEQGISEELVEKMLLAMNAKDGPMTKEAERIKNSETPASPLPE